MAARAAAGSRGACALGESASWRACERAWAKQCGVVRAAYKGKIKNAASC